jgi:hypothetical protein
MRSGLSKFAAATVRIAEQQKDHILSGSSGPAKNDGSFMDRLPKGFLDGSENSGSYEMEARRQFGKPEPQDERH